MERIELNVTTGEKRIVSLTAEEIAARNAWLPTTADRMNDLRRERDRRLAETDYLALSDVTLSTEMAEYRQALRDLPANTSDPANPVWPTKPGA